MKAPHQYSLTGPDGSVWDLNNGPVFLGENVIGFSKPATDQYTRQGPFTHGQAFTGWRAQERRVFLPLTIAAGDDQQAVSAAFWRILQPDRYCTFTVDDRTLRIRFVDDGNMPYESDPNLEASEVLTLNMVADDPWWRGPLITQVFKQQTDTGKFFDPDGPPRRKFHLQSGYSVDRATVVNPGDQPAWASWRIDGGLVEGFSVGQGDGVSSASFAVLEGERVEFDTDPRSQVIRRYPSGERLQFAAFDTINFRPLPPGDPVALTTTIQGEGNVTLSFYPRYDRAFAGA